jgi:hypothetical protein
MCLKMQLHGTEYFLKTDSRSDDQQISLLLYNPELHYHHEIFQLLRSILSQFNLVSLTYLFNISFILASASEVASWLQVLMLKF